MHRHRRKMGCKGKLRPGEVSAAAEAWAELPDAMKVQARGSSQARSLTLRYTPDPLDAFLEKTHESDTNATWTPWSMGSTMYPLSVETLDQNIRPDDQPRSASWVEDWSASWRKKFDGMVMHDETFPKSVRHKDTCGK